MRYPSTRAASVHALFFRAAFSRLIDTCTTKQSYLQRPYLQRQGSAQINLTAVLIKTFSADTAILLSGWLLSASASWSIGTISVPYKRAALLLPPQWLMFVVCLLLPSVWLAVDAVKALSYPQSLPFAGLPSVLKKVYEERFHWLLLSFFFVTTLMLLCWAATEMLLVSKLFVSAMFAIALRSLDQRMRSRRRSLLVSSLLFFGLFTIVQVMIMTQLTTNFVEDKLAPLTLLNKLGFDKQRELPINDKL